MSRPTIAVGLPEPEHSAVLVALQEAGFGTVALASAQDLAAILEAELPVGLAIVEAGGDPATLLDAVGRLRVDQAAVPLMVIADVEHLETLQGDGGLGEDDEVVLRPIEPDAIRWRAEAMLIRSQIEAEHTEHAVMARGRVEADWAARSPIIAIFNPKGGVGKTTIAATLGSTFASIRGDRVVAVDANPDRGTLSQKISLETSATVRTLLHDAGTIERYSDVRRYTSKGASGLEVLSSETDPAISEAFSAEDYARILDILERFYGLVLTDCGPGLLHSVMTAVLDKADALVVVSSASIDGARSASATLDWLDAHGHEDLVRNSIAVINGVRPRPGKIDMNKVIDHFSRRCRAVLLVPFDPHLEEGAEIDLDRLRRGTREALTELAAIVADGFPGDQRNPGVLG